MDATRFGLRLSVTAHALSIPAAAPLVHLERELAHAAALSVAYGLDLFEPDEASGGAAGAGAIVKGPSKGAGGMREILGWSWVPMPSAGASIDGANVMVRRR